jgi:hypothetical protein
MSVESAIRGKLVAASGVTNVVGQRIYPHFVPQGRAYPAITYFRVDTARVDSHDQAGGLFNSRFQIDLWGADPDVLFTLAEAVRAVLNGFRGTTGGVAFGAILLADERDGPYEPGAELFRRSQDYFVWAQEAA